MNLLVDSPSSRRIAVFLGCCLLSLAIAAPASADDGPSQAQRKVIVGVPESFPPYYQLDKDGNPFGFAIAVMNEVAKRAGLSVTYRVKKNWGEIFKALRTGDIDIVPNLGITERRKDYVAYTVPLETFHISIFVRDDTDDVKGLGDLVGRPIAVVATNAARRILKSRDDIQLRVFDNFTEALFALLSAEVDAFAFPEPVTWKLAREARVDQQIKVVGEPLKEIKRGMAVPKDKVELLTVLDRAVRDFVASPEYRSIYVAWFGKPKPFWTVARVAWSMGGIMAFLFLCMGWWRYSSVLRLNQALGESEAWLRAVIKWSPGAVVIRNLEGRNLIVNETFGDWYAVDRDEIIGKTLYDYLPPEIFEEIAAQEQEVVKTKQIVQAERRVTFPDGVTRDVFSQKFPIFDEDGKVIAIGGMNTDITERKRVEEALRESEDLLNSIIENVPVGLLIKDPDHIVELANDTYLSWYGFNTDTMAGRRSDEIEDFQSAEEAVFMNAQEREVLRTGNTLQRQVERTFADGQIHTIDITKFPVYDQQGNITKVGSVSVDLTEQVEAQKAANAALQEAEAANRAKSEFLATMSHELRTPLNAILGFAEILSHQYFGPISDKYKEYAEDIQSSGEHLLTLINDILDLSTIEAGKQSLVKEKLSTEEIVAECERIVEDKARSHGIDLVTEVPKDLPPLYADRRAAKQILLNLLSNAVKFTPQGGRVTVSVKASKRNTTLKIADTGKGIPAENLPKLTDPFTRINPNPYQTEQGWGLGLAITKSLIDLHDGKLDIKSTVGKGTTVTVTFPNEAP